MKILIAGDFAPRARLAQQIENKDFSTIFPSNLRDIIKSVDFSFVNFESPITELGFSPIQKCGPNLHCTEEAAEAIAYAGFTGVTMANNHILDFGAEGLHKSVECCKEQDLDFVGVGNNLKEAAKILYLEKGNKILAVINCCEHEFSIATETEAGANPLNPVQQFYAIQEAKEKADYVLVIVHGGHEHFSLPSPRMQELYRFFVEVGADAVINHHQHCFSGYEIYKGKPIFYGIGNFCFDIAINKVGESWNLGYMVELTFSENIKFKFYPYKQYGQQPTIKLLKPDAFDCKLEKLNTIISNPAVLREYINDYYSQCSNIELSILEPYSGRILSKLFRMGMLPKFIKGKKHSSILNHVNCEAHHDKLIFALEQNNK